MPFTGYFKIESVIPFGTLKKELIIHIIAYNHSGIYVFELVGSAENMP